MDIKIKARLSAYSKVNSFGDVNIDNVRNSDIDTLFKEEPKEGTVTKDEIDTLFSNEPNKYGTVDKDTIDTLFTEEDEEEVESVSFDEIDSLFKK